MSTFDVQKAAMEYQQLLQQGVPAAQAFKQAFPNGIPTALDRAKAAAAAQQKAGIGQIGGMLVGALGSKAVFDAVTGKPILGIGKLSDIGSATANAIPMDATNAATGLTEATNDAWNAGANAESALTGGGGIGGGGAGGVADASAGTGSLGNFAGSATPYLGAAGTALGAYEALQGVKNHNPLSAGLGGLGAGLGINAMGYALGPWGWAAMAGIPIASALLGGLGDKDRWKDEQNNVQGLVDSGTTGWAQLQASQPHLTHGRSIADLQAVDAANQAAGKWANPTFTASRNESDLKPEDIWGYSTFGKQFGNDWLGKFSEDQRRQIAQAALNSGAVQEHRGTVDVDWSHPELQAQINQITNPQQQQNMNRRPTAMEAAQIKQNGQLGDKLVAAMR